VSTFGTFRPRIFFLAIAGVWLVASVVLAVSGCGLERRSPESGGAIAEREPADYVTAIHDMLALDGELAVDRNHDSESVTIAEAIRRYVAGIDSADFSACPIDFREAFLWHRNVWEESIPFFERFPDLRGEMHLLFDEIRGRGAETQVELERIEASIWDSWLEVESVAADYGAIEPSAGGSSPKSGQ